MNRLTSSNHSLARTVCRTIWQNFAIYVKTGLINILNGRYALDSGGVVGRSVTLGAEVLKKMKGQKTRCKA